MTNNEASTALKLHVGIDVGGTKIEGVVLDNQRNELVRLRVQTDVAEGYRPVVHRIAQMYASLNSAIQNKPHTLGICTPGTVSNNTGLLKNSNATQLNGFPLKNDLSRLLKRPFALENDANCFALAEATFGAAKGYRNVLGLVMGTGVGAGIVFNGALLEGRNRVAGEWGHMSIDPQGPICFCGRNGCVERYISGKALEESYYQLSGYRQPLEAIVQSAQAGESYALQVMEAFLDKFTDSVANVVAILDPDVIVVGGGLASIDYIFTEGRERLMKIVFGNVFDTPIVRNILGNTAGVIGAATIGI